MSRDHAMHLLWDAAAARAPDRTAVRDDRGCWTYERLAALGARCARWLAERGVRPGDRVVVRLPSCREIAVLLYGASLAGAILAPVSTGLRPYQLGPIVADADPALLVVTDDEVAAVAALTGRPVVGLRSTWPELAGTSGAAPARPPSGGDIALLLYTSGTTATPKAVICPHAQVGFATKAIARGVGYRADDVVFSRLPPSFDYGLYQFLLCATAGAELVLAGDAVNAGLFTRLRSSAATVVPLVPSLATMLTALAARDRRPNRVRMFTNTGDFLAPATIARLRRLFPGASVVLMFGTTECKRVSILHPDGDLDRPGSVGTPLAGTEVLVVDEAGRPLPPGEVGEIVVRGPHVMAGYWNAPELTDHRFRRADDTGAASLHTGDFGWLDGDGYLYFEGRRDNIVKLAGVRVSTLEIEAAALDVPGVRQAAVVLPAPGSGGIPVLCVVGDRAPAEVLRAIADRLEPTKVPGRCLVLDRLPLTAHGKTDRTGLAKLVGEVSA